MMYVHTARLSFWYLIFVDDREQENLCINIVIALIEESKNLNDQI